MNQQSYRNLSEKDRLDFDLTHSAAVEKYQPTNYFEREAVASIAWAQFRMLVEEKLEAFYLRNGYDASALRVAHRRHKRAMQVAIGKLMRLRARRQAA
jgi:hypothetical protein